MTVTVVVGAPCSGKTTYIREHAAVGDLLVDFDALAVALGSPEPWGATGAIRDAALAARSAAIGVALASDSSAWIIHTNPNPEQINDYTEHGVKFLLCDPGVDECLARAESDERPDGTIEAINAWYDNPPSLPTEQKARTMKTATFKAKVQATGADAKADGLADGQFRALVSVFGNVDSYGEVVAPGAFAKSLADWEASGDAIPVVWSHDWANPFAHIGTVIKAEETYAGLVVTGQIEDIDENPTAKQVYRLLKSRRVTQFSFAYDVLDAEDMEVDGQEVKALLELKLHEVGPCLVGVNQETQLLAAKAGRVLAQKHLDTLKGAADSILAVIAAAEPEKASVSTGTDQAAEPSQAAEPLPDDEPDVAKSEAAPRAPRRALATATIQSLNTEGKGDPNGTPRRHGGLKGNHAIHSGHS